MNTRRYLLLALLLTLAPRPALAQATHEYFGIYMPGGKIGFLHVSRDGGAIYAGKKSVRSEAETRVAFNALGSVAESATRTVSYSDPKTGVPLYMVSRTEAAGRVSFVTATFGVRSVSFAASIAGTKRTGTLTLAPGESFLRDLTGGANAVLPVGTVLRGKAFVPETLHLADETVTVIGKETLTLPGATKPVETFVWQDRAETGTVLLNVSAANETVRLRFPLGMEARHEPKAVALVMPTAAEIIGRPDVAVAASITPTGSVDAVRDAPVVRYLLRGSTSDLPPSDNRQSITFSGTGDTRAATVTVSATPLPALAGLHCYKSPADAPEALRPYLLPSDYVSSGDPVFVALAKDATGGETDLAVASAKIAAFVHDAITPDSGIPALRTATDIEKNRRGVCREYTTFFAAIARSAGIPTRVCVGVVLAENTFAYHAWPEVWTGDKTGWIALEPTWGKPFADATHIKLAQGEITDLYRVASDMGHYRLEVLP